MKNLKKLTNYFLEKGMLSIVKNITKHLKFVVYYFKQH